MFRKFITAVSLASAATIGLAATPVMAQSGSYSYSESYRGDDGSYYRNESYRDEGYRDGGYRGGYRDDVRYRDYDRYDGRPDGYARGDYYRGGPAYGYAPPPHRNRGYNRCSDGTTGAIAGAVLGGLLGREIGRGGRWNRPSTTGLILGAGGGALAGRAIERDGCR